MGGITKRLEVTFLDSMEPLFPQNFGVGSDRGGCFAQGKARKFNEKWI